MGMTIDGLKQECKYCYREVDSSGLEGFRCTNKTVNMETSWCRPKNANKPCSICEYCKPREETEMTIDEAINHIEYGIIENNYPLQRDLGIEACNLAIDTMRKFQKIKQIIEVWHQDIYAKDFECIAEVAEVVEDGNDD